MPAPVSTGTVWPLCLGGECNSWGAAKAHDGRTQGLNSLAHSHWGTNPYIQLALGTFSGNITAVRIHARSDCCADQGSNLNIYLSATNNFTGTQSTLCAAGINVGQPRAIVTVLCPVVPWTARFVTVMRNVSWHVISLNEIVALYDGEALQQDHESGRVMRACA